MTLKVYKTSDIFVKIHHFIIRCMLAKSMLKVQYCLKTHQSSFWKHVMIFLHAFEYWHKTISQILFGWYRKRKFVPKNFSEYIGLLKRTDVPIYFTSLIPITIFDEINDTHEKITSWTLGPVNYYVSIKIK